jgi:uncharacterized protein YdaU (DUF1376 family)
VNYFPLHIGDYLADTSHLTPHEHGFYVLMILAYYKNERPLPKCKQRLYRLVQASDKKGRGIVDRVLEDFFIETDGGYINNRCDQEIAKYRANNEQAKAAARASVEARSAKRNTTEGQTSATTPVQRPFNARSTPVVADVQRTNNQEPITKAQNQEKEFLKKENFGGLNTTETTHETNAKPTPVEPSLIETPPKPSQHVRRPLPVTTVFVPELRFDAECAETLRAYRLPNTEPPVEVWAAFVAHHHEKEQLGKHYEARLVPILFVRWLSRQRVFEAEEKQRKADKDARYKARSDQQHPLNARMAGYEPAPAGSSHVFE